jgi:hypothetical protein
MKQSKSYKVKNVWTKDSLTWPGHFASSSLKTTGTNAAVEMCLTTLDGWLLIRHKGELAVTNGILIAELENKNSDKEE